MLLKEIENLLRSYINPYLGKDLVSTNKLKISLATDHNIRIEIDLGFPCQRDHSSIKQALSELLASCFSAYQFEFIFHTVIKPRAIKPGLQSLPMIKNVIAVGSGKGGVGKSTVAVNIALALAKEGAAVGMLDADIYGPSQPSMFGTSSQKPIIKAKKIHPIIQYGIATMSIGYLVDSNAPMVWRGPMLGKALEQLIQDTVWPKLDFLIIDLPPGTGDIQLSLCQKVPVNGAIIVTTPQDVALLDVVRSCEMFQKLDIPLLGVVENMATHVCSNCGHEERIFGEGGGVKLAQNYEMPLLTSIPLDLNIRLNTDRGEPPAIDETNDNAQYFYEAAKKASAVLSLQKINHTAKFPKIIVKHSKPGDATHEHKV